MLILILILFHRPLAPPTAFPPPDARMSADYTVWVDDVPAHVYASPVPASFCSFEMRRPVDITIKANRDVKWVDVRPHTAGIRAVFGNSDSTIRLSISQPVQLSIELNGSKARPLFLFADAPEKEKPAFRDSNTILFAAGKTYSPGIIRLKSGQSVYIERGALVFGAIRAKGASHIKISGSGVLDGSRNKGRFIELQDCDDVAIDDITLHDGRDWQIVPIHCNNVRVNNIKIISNNGGDDGMDIVRSRNVHVSHSFIRTKDDCIAIKSNMGYPSSDGVNDVLVENCVCWNGAWGNGFEIGFELDSDEIRDVVFRDNDIIHVESGAAISIHNAGKCKVHDILYDDIRIEDADQKLFDLAIFLSRYSNDAPPGPQRDFLHGAWDGVLPMTSQVKSTHAAFRGSVEHITFRKIQVTGGIFPFSIFYGFDPSHAVKDISVEDLSIYGNKINTAEQARCYMENASDIRFR